MLSFAIAHKKLTILNILHWIEQDLCPHLGPYPGPRSVVVFDNMPQHRSHQLRIEQAVNRRGAYVFWNPPNSPDLNPIEKLWDIGLAHSKRRMFELACGAYGAPRKFGMRIACSMLSLV